MSEPLATAAQALVRSTQEGDVIGFTGPYGEHAWLGVPYARPPVGERRWRPPQPALHRDRAIECTSPPPSCAQRIPVYMAASATPGTSVGSEDCLYLNIWCPAFPARSIPAGDARLPVMFWIHGGANVTGQAATYGGGALATTQRVIVVSANYRLGVLGWFRHAALRAATTDADERSGNFGTLDLVRALEWVRDNISAFGGDPGRVTLFGESAGGNNVYSLLASPRAAGLFHRAIAQSGTPETFGVDEAEGLTDDVAPGAEKSSGEMLLQLLIQDGSASSRNQAKARVAEMSPANMAGYLRSKSFADLDRAYLQLEVNSSDPAASLRPFPCVFRDGTVLPSGGIMAALGRKDGHNKVPVILGTTRDEFTVLLPLISGSLLAETTGAGFGFTIKDKARYSLIAEYLSRLLKAYAVDEPAIAIRRHSPDSVYIFRFDWDELPPAPWLDGIAPGATHGLDVPFVFGHLDLGPEFFQLPLIKEQSLHSFNALAAIMMSYWAAFADRGDPGSGRNGELPAWNPWTSASDPMMVFDAPSRGGSRLCSSHVTRTDVLADIVTDTRFGNVSERRQFLDDLLRIGGPYSLLAPGDLGRLDAMLSDEAP